MTVGRTTAWVCCQLVLLLSIRVALAQETPQAESTATAKIEAEQPIAEPAAESPAPVPSPKPDAATAGEAADEPADPKTLSPSQASAEDILREFQEDRPQAEPLLPQPLDDESIVREELSQGQGRGAALRMPDGYLMSDRVGRLVQDGVWWTVSFVADNHPEDAPFPPIKLLPNRMLERAIRESLGGSRQVDFVVAGEVTDFMGENFLLLRKLMRKRSSGNLSR